MDGLVILGILVFIAGFVFIGIEIVLPGFGAPGILGSCCLVAGVFMTTDTIAEAAAVVALVLILLVLFIMLMTTLLTKGRLKSPIVLEEKQEKKTGYISSNDLEYLIGKDGVATTDLRPAGRIQIEGVEFDVISDGRFILKGEKVIIYKISNSSLVVKAYNE